MLLTVVLVFFQAAPKDGLGLTIVVGIFSALIGALGVVLAARYGFLGKREEGQAARLARIEAREELCQEKLYKVRTIVTTLVMGQNIFARVCPEAKKEVDELQEEMREQLRELEILDEKEKDLHSTKAT